MSNKIDNKLDSKFKKNQKNNKDTNKQPISNNIQSNSKIKQKNLNFKQKTPIKDEKTRSNNKLGLNNNTIVASSNNHHHIINNVSININITNNEINKSNTMIGGVKNRSANKKKPIGLKRDELKNNENSLIMKNTKSNNKNNNNKPQRNNNSYHQRIQSAVIKSNKTINNKTNIKPSNNNKKNFNLTTTGFHPKKIENTKSENANKNISVNDIKIPAKNNVELDKNTITINVGQINTNNKKK